MEENYSGYLGFYNDARKFFDQHMYIESFDSINKAISEYSNGVELYGFRIKICLKLIENDQEMIKEILPIVENAIKIDLEKIKSNLKK